MLICEPYKSEILPHWRFKTPAMAECSSQAIYSLFLRYMEKEEFVGADLARKFLQMGFTRARRYTNYKGGRKYDKKTGALLEKGTGEPAKAESAAIFYAKWKEAEAHPRYQTLKKEWKKNFG